MYLQLQYTPSSLGGQDGDGEDTAECNHNQRPDE